MSDSSPEANLGSTPDSTSSSGSGSNSGSNLESGAEHLLLSRRAVVSEYIQDNGKRIFELEITEDMTQWEAKALLQHAIDQINFKDQVEVMIELLKADDE